MKKTAHLGFVVLFLSLLAGCATETTPLKTRATYTQVSFDDLKDWNEDHQAEALAAFRRSCGTLKNKAPWKDACANAPDSTNDTDARHYFETYFRVYAVSASNNDGLFTGYYVPELNASHQPQGSFTTPLYARPNDLISVDLGLFKPEYQGQHIVGKIDGNKFVPYDTRQTITTNALGPRAPALAYVDDPVSAFFLEVQGSGRLKFPDGSVQTVGYDAANGRSYVAIGKIMAERGDVPRPVTMPSIRAWLKANPDKAQEVMDENPSYVFFRDLPDDNVIGAEGVALTSQRSMAVDPSFITLGSPLWLDSYDGEGHALNRLMIAQDTGGAIKGPVRGDFFWGAGDEAGRQAGAMQSKGRYYTLLPLGLTPHDK